MKHWLKKELTGVCDNFLFIFVLNELGLSCVSRYMYVYLCVCVDMCVCIYIFAQID